MSASCRWLKKVNCHIITIEKAGLFHEIQFCNLLNPYATQFFHFFAKRMSFQGKNLTL